MPLKTIKQVRKDLKMWGDYWRNHEPTQGYARRSATDKLCEVLRTKVNISSDLHLFSHHADAIYVPPHIEKIDKAIEQLSIECRKAIKDRYQNLISRNDYYVVEAENSLLGLMSN